MKKRTRPSSEAAELRRRASERLAKDKTDVRRTEPHVDPKLFHELEIHRVELEIQNEELRAARVDLEAGLERYTELFDFAPIGYARLAADGMVRELNHAGAMLLGEHRSRVIGRPFSLFVASSDRSKLMALLEKALETHLIQTAELALSVDMHSLYVQLTARTLTRREPTILIAFQDVSAQKRLEQNLLRADQELRDADRRKDEFLAVLSHELRTPLSTLLMHSQMLRQGRVDPQKIRRSGEAIERATRAQLRLIEDLLDVSRIVAGKLSMKFEPVSLEPIIRTATETLEREAKRKRIELDLELDPTVPQVLGDAERLQQAISNLIVNSIKFTPEGGHIRVSLDEVDRRAHVEVRDTGGGVEAAALPHLFERFFQVDQTITRGTGGLGLGLSIVQSIVKAHGGTIEVESAGKGKGATFTVSLPVISAEQKRTPRQPVNGAASVSKVENVKGARLLVVEDDPDTRATLTDVLRRAGAKVRNAESVADAMRVLAKFNPDVLVCDVAMPKEDGCKLLHRIRARGPRRGGNVRALAITAFAGEDARARTREAGFEAHLVKPVEVQRLISAVSDLLPPREGSGAPP